MEDEDLSEFEKQADEYFNRVDELRSGIDLIWRAISTLDDRNVAIMAAAYLDELTLKVMKLNFIDDKKEFDLMASFDRPLGTTSSRIRLVYLLGKIPEIIAKDLRIVAAVRNVFAHNYAISSFSDNAFAKQIPRLSAVDKIYLLENKEVSPPNDPRINHRLGTSYMVSENVIRQISEDSRTRFVYSFKALYAFLLDILIVAEFPGPATPDIIPDAAAGP